MGQALLAWQEWQISGLCGTTIINKRNNSMRVTITFRFACVFLLLLANMEYCAAQNLKSIFDNKEGEYVGTVNGVLFLKRSDTKDIKSSSAPLTILDFQRGNAKLSVVHDPEEVYDSHTENFLGHTTSGKSAVTYSTYAEANAFQIKVGDDTYEVTTIDGACDTKIPGVLATYQTEGSQEYLVLRFSKEIVLDNRQPLFREYEQKNKKSEKPNDDEEFRFVKQRIKYVHILPESVLVYIIEGKTQ